MKNGPFRSITHPLHHAYLVEGDFERQGAELQKHIASLLKMDIEGNPDFQVRSFDVLGVDEARELKAMAGLRPSAGEHQCFIIGARTLTREAQNALLKLFEEPGKGVHFFLILADVQRILPTLRSRFFLVTPKRGEVGTAEALAFLRAPIGERLTVAKRIADEKDREGARALLESLITHLNASKERHTHLKQIKEINTLRSYLHDRASSIKMILEHLALSLPTP